MFSRNGTRFDLPGHTCDLTTMATKNCDSMRVDRASSKGSAGLKTRRVLSALLLWSALGSPVSPILSYGQFTEVTVELEAPLVKDALPFDVPFILMGKIPTSTDSVVVRYKAVSQMRPSALIFGRVETTPDDTAWKPCVGFLDPPLDTTTNGAASVLFKADTTVKPDQPVTITISTDIDGGNVKECKDIKLRVEG